MDSLNLISKQKTEKSSFKNNSIKKNILLKCIIIILVLLFISNIYNTYFIINLNKIVGTLNMNMNTELSKNINKTKIIEFDFFYAVFYN